MKRGDGSNMKVRTLNKLIKGCKESKRRRDLQVDLLGRGYRMYRNWWGWTIVKERGRPGKLQLEQAITELSRFDNLREERFNRLKNEKKSKRKNRRSSRLNRYGQRGI